MPDVLMNGGYAPYLPQAFTPQSVPGGLFGTGAGGVPGSLFRTSIYSLEGTCFIQLSYGSPQG